MSHELSHTEHLPSKGSLPLEKEPLPSDNVQMLERTSRSISEFEERAPAWARFRKVMREPFSEFFGTMILVLFGDGSVAQVVLGKGGAGDWQSINWGWAYAFLPSLLDVMC